MNENQTGRRSFTYSSSGLKSSIFQHSQMTFEQHTSSKPHAFSPTGSIEWHKSPSLQTIGSTSTGQETHSKPFKSKTRGHTC